jgi:hypothetical protein
MGCGVRDPPNANKVKKKKLFSREKNTSFLKLHFSLVTSVQLDKMTIEPPFLLSLSLSLCLAGARVVGGGLGWT